ncbi:Uncharacterised protein [Mycobacterium tuberculosis]|nr:Uncharacterised protein [Streptococcus pneumoniae]CKU59397.1 Uncharacterised protein [Mycobacterium tuberculosis]
MNDDDSRCIHIERDGKTIEFGYLNISSTDRNTSHADGLVGIFNSNFSGVRVRGIAVFLNGPDNLDTTLVGNFQTIWNFRIICIHS